MSSTASAQETTPRSELRPATAWEAADHLRRLQSALESIGRHLDAGGWLWTEGDENGPRDFRWDALRCEVVVSVRALDWFLTGSDRESTWWGRRGHVEGPARLAQGESVAILLSASQGLNLLQLSVWPAGEAPLVSFEGSLLAPQVETLWNLVAGTLARQERDAA